MLEPLNRSARRWIGRLALVPLGVYAIGIPVQVLVRGSGVVVRDGLLPFEVAGLVACLVLAAWGSFQ